ncbi:ATP-binding protein [Paenibacillus sp. GP183]|uniref:ATP-binding protein n=1 Tax=Paenibacillus sp. GP183 TaxID=1882751 RepID=UPI0008951E54|nr:ATP-binding protein [Paenibacillus sp. GP183]SEC41002.1 TniB protein [Paenibacillus sp. GP183]
MTKKIAPTNPNSIEVPRFPEALLSSSIQERVKYFENYQTNHPHLSEARDKLLDAITNPGNRSIVMVCGPSGVGKSTLFKVVRNHIIKNFVQTNKGHIPIVGVEAVAPDNSNFDIRDFYIRSLEALMEPLIEYKIYYEDDIKYSNDDKNRDLRKSLENALKNRAPKAFLIDEAQHFTKVTSGKKLEGQMDLLKSMASLSKVLHVLIGTYELVPFINQSGQLSRREFNIHLPRYRHENKNDMQAFENVIYIFQRNIPLEKEPDLVSHIDYLYEGTIGCVGTLKDWLFKAVKETLESKKKKLTMDCLKKHAYQTDQCMTMLLEARENEDFDVENEIKSAEYRNLLYHGVIPSNKNQSKKNETNTGGNKKPGVRKPTRDPVGVQQM